MLLVLYVNSAMVASLFSEFLIKQALYKLASSTFAKKDFSPCPCADTSHIINAGRKPSRQKGYITSHTLFQVDNSHCLKSL